MSTITQDLQSIKTVEDTLTSNKVARFAYTQQAYTDNDADGVTEYNPNQEQNIPVADASVMKVNSSILNLGWRAQASALTRMLMNHFLGRISYNLNKVNDNVSAILSALIAKIGQAEGIASLGDNGKVPDSQLGRALANGVASLEANGKVPDAQLGRALANGVASLDENGRIPYSQLPEDALELKGYWDASTNTPALADGTGTSGDFYFVEVAGTQDLGSGEQYFAVGDRVLYDGSIWKNVSSGFIRKINNQAPDAQGNKEVTLGNMTLNVTKGFLGAIFSKLLAYEWQYINYTSANPDSIGYYKGLLLVSTSTQALAYSKLPTVRVSSSNIKALRYAYNSNNQLDMNSDILVAGSASADTAGFYWSEDGKNWTQGTGGTPRVIAIIHANGLYVATTFTGCWWSEDGKNWTQGTGGNTSYQMGYPAQSLTTSFIYNNGLWLASSTANGIWWSEDGKNWTQGTGSITTFGIRSFIYASTLDIYVALNFTNSGASCGAWWSNDGKSWTQCTDLPSAQTNQVCYASNRFVASSSSKGVWWSDNGKSWTQGTGVTSTYTCTGCGFGNGYFWAGFRYQNNEYGLWKSVDGKIWTQTSITTGSLIACKEINGLTFAFFNNGVKYTLDGVNWQSIISTQGSFVNCVNGQIFVKTSSTLLFSLSISDVIDKQYLALGQDIALIDD